VSRFSEVPPPSNKRDPGLVKQAQMPRQELSPPRAELCAPMLKVMQPCGLLHRSDRWCYYCEELRRRKEQKAKASVPRRVKRGKLRP
jgi:hypothetical protein